MNIFFYSSGTISCRNDCSYMNCAAKFIHELKKIQELQDMQVLPDGSLFPLPIDTPLRSGDLVLLHAADHRALEKLLKNRKSFDGYRLILIVSDEVFDTSRRYHLLNPRYITTVKQGIQDLKEVVAKIVQQFQAANGTALVRETTPSIP